VAGLVLAHDRALVVQRSHRDATRSQLVMLVLMVCFTCLGLWLLSAANG
jgi:heme/copper-type cytochrome/quinol oxidase subunit 4